MLLQNIFDTFNTWFFSNLFILAGYVIAIIVGIIVYHVIKRQLNYLKRHKKLPEQTAKNLRRLTKLIIFSVLFSIILFQFADSVGLVAALLTVSLGTIIGFAAINTIGNAIAGLIIMSTKPLTVGDRIVFEDKMADVKDITMIYTILEDLDNNKIIVPNQILLSRRIINLGKDKTIRRHITVTPGFEVDRLTVEKVLLDAIKNIKQILPEPSPYVWISAFQNYAVEYHLYYFINDIYNLPFIESEAHKAVLDECNKNNIDISTPMLLKRL